MHQNPRCNTRVFYLISGPFYSCIEVMSILYIVATPIGNLEDITLRALRVLKEVDLILCEDTRVTKKLLNHYKINTPTESYHSQSRFTKVEKILRLLEEGKHLALVTDSGTPALSDPGSHLVSLAREKFGERVETVPIPGPSALGAALSVAGLPVQEFVFLGFLPRKKGRETALKQIAGEKRTIVLYESPHRVMKTLKSLEVKLAPDRKVVVAKELTKIYEEIVSGTPENVRSYFEKNLNKVRGEFVILVSGA